MTVNYSESAPRDANSIDEFAPDVWTDNYPSDVMFWVDTHGRCNEGAFGSTVLGHATIDGQNWTVHRYGGAGAEIIFTLDDGAGGCAQQTSGTVDIKAGFDWLVANGYTSSVVFSQLNTGFEITSADDTTFSVSSYSITATVAGSPTPTPTSTSPSPSPTTSTPTPTPTTSSPSSSATSSSPTATPTTSTPAPPSSSSTPQPTGLLVGDDGVEPVVDGNQEGTAEAFSYVAAKTGTSATISLYVDTSNSATAGTVGVYTNWNGAANKLLGQASFVPTPGWDTVTLPGVKVFSGRRYRIAELGTTGRLAFRDQGSGSSYSQTASVGSTLPVKWPGGTQWSSGRAWAYVAG